MTMGRSIKRKRRRDSNSWDDDVEASGGSICHNINLLGTSSTNRMHVVACLALLLLWALVVTGVVLVLLSSSSPVKSSYRAQSRSAALQQMYMNLQSQSESEMTRSMISSRDGILRRRKLLQSDDAATINHDANEWLLQRDRLQDSEREGENRIKKSQNRREQEYDKYEPSKTGPERDDDNPFDHWNSNAYGGNGSNANGGYFNATAGNFSSDMNLSKRIAGFASSQQPAFQNVIVYHNLISMTVYAALPAYSKSVGWTISDMVTDYLNQSESSLLGELCNFYFTHPNAEMNLPSQTSLATSSGQDDDLGNLDNGSPVNGPKRRALLNQALWDMHHIDQRARLYLVVDDVWWWEVRCKRRLAERIEC